MPRTSITPQTRQRARVLRNNATPHERRLWAALRLLNKQRLKFRRQAAIGPFIGDFVDYGRKLVVELDGSQHGEPKGEAGDARRSRWLESQGFTVLRVWNGDVERNLGGGGRNHLPRGLTAWRRHPSPNPSPQGGGELQDECS